MPKKVVVLWCDDLDDVVRHRVDAAVARLIGKLYRDCRDGDILAMVLDRAEVSIRKEMEQLLRDVEDHSLICVCWPAGRQGQG